MSLIKKNISKKTLAKIIAILAGVLLIVGYTIWDIAAKGPITSLLSNHDEVVKFVENMGPAAPLAYIVLQVLQIILAPIPGQIVNGVGGYIFGWWGILWTIIGSFFGYFVVILLAKKFGRPLLEKIFKKESIEKFDFIFNNNAAIILFLIFLLPGLPDDMIGYMAGLTKLSVKELLIIIIVGKTPVWIITNYIGMGLGEENLTPVIIISVIVVIIFAVALLFKDKIMRFIKKQGEK